MSELSKQEIFDRAREAFIASLKLDDKAIDEILEFNKDLHTHTCEELFRVLR
jgi:hypothetical protein